MTTASASRQIHLALALDGAGWHPAAWREPEAVAAAGLFGADYWLDQVRRAEAAHLDFVTIEDGFPLQTGGQVRGRLEILREATGADELIVTTITHRHADRVRSFELLAEEWAER